MNDLLHHRPVPVQGSLIFQRQLRNNDRYHFKFCARRTGWLYIRDPTSLPMVAFELCRAGRMLIGNFVKILQK
jgi:hypothetical protein